MTIGDRVALWNRRYDNIPELLRFQFVLWPLLAVGTINMILTVAVGFPFALLLVLAVLALAAVRVPYLLGWVSASQIPETEPAFQIAAPQWLIDLNLRYEAMPESRRVWVYPAVLLIGGAVNMMLTIAVGFPFGLLFLLTVLAVVAVRAPYTAGWLKLPMPESAAATSAMLDHDATAPAVKDPGPTGVPDVAPPATTAEQPVAPSLPAAPAPPPTAEQPVAPSLPAAPAPPPTTDQSVAPSLPADPLAEQAAPPPPTETSQPAPAVAEPDFPPTDGSEITAKPAHPE